MKHSVAQFNKLTIDLKQKIESYTNLLPPYSDYNFFSLWTYNTEQNIEYAIVNSNLVIKFLEYDGSNYFYSFFGNSQIEKTAIDLLNLATINSHIPTLKLIPEHCLYEFQFNNILVDEDKDNFDYVLSVEKLVSLTGPKLHQKAKSLKHFIREYPDVEIKIGTIPDNQKNIHQILEKWQGSYRKNKINNNEIKAIHRSIKFAKYFSAQILLIMQDNEPIGFTIFEIVQHRYCISSFQKADDTYYGIYEFMNNQLAIYLQKQGVEFINIEQDLGLPGLRQAKQKYDPTFLKKYSISLK